jgi:hypothetical protein
MSFYQGMLTKHWPKLALIGALAATLFFSYELKRPCTELPWTGQQYSNLCYNDIQGLYGSRKLNQRAFPYVEEKSYEYPVIMGFAMWTTSLFATTDAEYFRANLPLLSLAALLSLVGLMGAVGPRRRLLWFAAGTPILFYSFLNWDLLPVAFVCLAFWSWSKNRHWTTGALLGLGVAAKIYPGFFLPPLLLALFIKKEDRRKAIQMGLSAALAWEAVNLPFMIAEYLQSGGIEGWIAVFQFHAKRTPDFGAIWHWLAEITSGNFPAYFSWLPSLLIGGAGIVAVSRLRERNHRIFGSIALFVAVAGISVFMHNSAIEAGSESEPFRKLVDVCSEGLFGVGYLTLLALQIRRPSIDPWRIGASALALYLMVSKIHSPQHALWILPLMAAFETSPKVLLAYLASDTLIFVTEFTWFATAPQLQANTWEYLFGIGVALRFVALGAFVVTTLKEDVELALRETPEAGNQQDSEPVELFGDVLKKAA